MNDPLLEATRALREFGKPSDGAGSLTRARLLVTLERSKRKSKRRLLVTLPLAALLMGSLAMAATGAQLRAPIQRWLAALTRQAPTSVAKQGSRAPARSSAQAVHSDARMPEALSSASRALEAEGSLQPEHAVVVKDNPPVNGASIQPRVAASQPMREEEPMTEEEYARYRAAHEAHFVNKDPAGALAAWTEYLAHSPGGRLAVEARYNRALCLLKLGRNQEAIVALRPFTQGSYGAYRQKEARRLIAQLDLDAGR
jgi:hypothetical protein